MVQRKRILLIEDEEDIASMIKLQGELSGYQIHVEVDGINGLRAAEREHPDLILLDVMLPGKNGLDVLRAIYADASLRGIPVIIISAKTDELDLILGLELGADDYIEKPFSPKVLMSRIKAVLRRKRDTDRAPKNIIFGEFTLEVDRYLLRKNDKVIPITLSEFGILKRLLQNRGKVLTRNQLLDDIHNEDSFVVDRNIDVHIASLRRKLGPNFKWIDTVRGIGYRFKLELSEQDIPTEELVTS